MNFDKVKRVPLCLFTVYFLKLLAGNPTWVDGAVLLVLGGAAAFYEAWAQLEIYKQVEARMDAFDKKNAEFEKAQQEIKAYVSSMKLGQQLRAGVNGR